MAIRSRKEIISFAGTANDTEDGDISANLSWESDLDNNIGSGASFNTTSLTVGTHVITASVTDAGGETVSETITITVNAAVTNVFLVMDPETSNVTEGDVFDIRVDLQANDQPISAASLEITFDPTVLQVVSLTPPNPHSLSTELANSFDNTAGTITYEAGQLGSPFPTGTFEMITIEFEAIGAPSSAVEFVLEGEKVTKVLFGADDELLTGVTNAVVNVTALPDLLVEADPDAFSAEEGDTDTQTGTLNISTSDAGTPTNLNVVSDASWLTINGTNDGFTIDPTGLTAAQSPYTATITATADGYGEGTAVVTLEIMEPGIPQALVEVTPGSGIDATTFGGDDKLQITNQSVGRQITSVSFDLSTGMLPDMVFDPDGSGGDATAQCFTPDPTFAANTGLIPFGDNCVDPFSQPRNGGFDIITVNFTDFDPGETFTFTTDIDPNSIQGISGAGFSGAVSGLELAGATITVTFSDGTLLVSNLYEDGSLGGAQCIVSESSAALSIPTISVDGIPATPATVSEEMQNIVISGTPGDYVSLLQLDARLLIASGDPPFDVSDETYYANELVAKSIYNDQIGVDGTVTIPVTLLATPSGDNTPDGGLNHFMAVASETPYAIDLETSASSNTIILKLEESATIIGTALLEGRANVNPVDHSGDLTVSLYEAGTGNLVETYNVTSNADGEFTLTEVPEGNFDIYVNAAGFLQVVEQAVSVTAGSAQNVDFGVLPGGDFNNDNLVDLSDFSILSPLFLVINTDPAYNPDVDLNKDGVIDLSDFSILSGNFLVLGATPPTP